MLGLEDSLAAIIILAPLFLLLSSIPAVEFSGTPHAVSLPFLTLPMSEAAFLLSF